MNHTVAPVFLCHLSLFYVLLKLLWFLNLSTFDDPGEI